MNIQRELKRHSITSIWHFTDKSNLASIKKYGLLSLSHLLQTNIFVPCFGVDKLKYMIVFFMKKSYNNLVLSFKINHE